MQRKLITEIKSNSLKMALNTCKNMTEIIGKRKRNNEPLPKNLILD